MKEEIMKINEEIVRQAEMWFKINDVIVVVDDLSGSGYQRIYIITQDNNSFSIEVSGEEIEYRAELYRESDTYAEEGKDE